MNIKKNSLKEMMRKKTIHERVGVSDHFDIKIVRGSTSWAFLSLCYGLFVAIELGIIQLLPLGFPWGLLLFIVLFGGTAWLVFCHGRFQDWLITIKVKHQSRAR